MLRNGPPLITKNGIFPRLFELDGWSFSAVDQSQNMVGTFLRIWATLGFVSEV